MASTRFHTASTRCRSPARPRARHAWCWRCTRKLAAGRRKRGYDLYLGAGIAQGFADIDSIGFDRRIDFGAIDTVTNLAARLCGEASGGETLLAFNVEAVPELMLKGFQRPIAAFRPLGD